MAQAKPFKLRVTRTALADLRKRLTKTRWPDDVEGMGWELGADVDYLRELVTYWNDVFDWRVQEAAINQLPQFRTEVDGLGLHFIHVKGSGPDPMPLLLSHGWPDSFLRMMKIIPLLADPAGHGGDARDSFDVVVPSLPGFGLSDRIRDLADASTRRMADRLARLMTETLGYRRFGAHGGDVGSAVTEQLGRLHADALIGLHLTEIPYQHIFAIPPEELSEAERAYVDAGRKWQMEEGAYAMLQATKPQSLACGLNDSPAGLAAWFVEKFRRWSDCGGDVERCFTKDELLTNITLYWVTETIGSSMLYYYASMHPLQPDVHTRVEVPAGVAIFPKDLVTAPREFAERIFDVRRWTAMPRGGHFAAMEAPELLAEDIRAFFRPLRRPGD